MTVVNGSLVSRSGGNSTSSGPVQVSTKLTENVQCPLAMTNDQLVHLTVFSVSAATMLYTKVL